MLFQINTCTLTPQGIRTCYHIHPKPTAPVCGSWTSALNLTSLSITENHRFQNQFLGENIANGRMRGVSLVQLVPCWAISIYKSPTKERFYWVLTCTDISHERIIIWKWKKIWTVKAPREKQKQG